MIEQIAESFINGNFAWVKANCRTKKRVAQVARYLLENHPKEAPWFLNLFAK